ncbi:MAG: hypothetical protein HYY37_01500 [Candidatus Aenigmarchaeota archaeon]|nr:hypothetical protein [Candidatus Aenigmarchaeota archaeon]
MDAFIYRIATLGPGGSDSERAAMYFGDRLWRHEGSPVRHREAFHGPYSGPVKIVLRDSFEESLQEVREGGADFGVVPAAYNNLFRLHCQYRDLDIWQAFPLPTKEMVLAQRPGTKAVRKVALHPTTEPLAPPGTELLYIPSKPRCVEAVIHGEADAAIGSRDVAEQHGLEVVENFGSIPMTWEVFRRRR